jgi:hypothetical protein
LWLRLKRKGAGIGRKQTNKAAKDLNKPKRLSWSVRDFFVFMYDIFFRFESVFVVIIYFFRKKCFCQKMLLNGSVNNTQSITIVILGFHVSAALA